MTDDPMNFTKVARGEDLPQAKLTNDDIASIRELVEHRRKLLDEAKAITNMKLARKFGVSVSNINKIAMGYTWRHL